MAIFFPKSPHYDAPRPEDVSEEYPPCFVKNLAGNAFDASCCMAAEFVMLGILFSRRVPSRVALPHDADAEAMSVDSDSDESDHLVDWVMQGRVETQSRLATGLDNCIVHSSIGVFWLPLPTHMLQP